MIGKERFAEIDLKLLCSFTLPLVTRIFTNDFLLVIISVIRGSKNSRSELIIKPL
jgi:hypothetical protein